MGQMQFVTALVLIGLFTIAIIGFAINFGNDNNSAIDISNDPELSSLDTRTTGNISQFSDDSKSQYSSIINTTVEPGSQTSTSSAPFTITITSSLGVVINILKIGYIKIFGTGSGFGIFLTTFISVLTFAAGLWVWKTFVGRSPD